MYTAGHVNNVLLCLHTSYIVYRIKCIIRTIREQWQHRVGKKCAIPQTPKSTHAGEDARTSTGGASRVLTAGRAIANSSHGRIDEFLQLDLKCCRRLGQWDRRISTSKERRSCCEFSLRMEQQGIVRNCDVVVADTCFLVE